MLSLGLTLYKLVEVTDISLVNLIQGVKISREIITPQSIAASVANQ